MNLKKVESLSKALFLACSLTSVLTLFIIIFFMFSRGVPAIFEVGVTNFLFGTTWRPLSQDFGIFSFIIASVITTTIAVIVGSRIGLWCAIYLALFCPNRFYKPLKTMVELLGGIPSVLYGFFGVVVVVPFIRNYLGALHGNSLLAATIILSIMILPTIINLSEAAIRAVPNVYFEGALALGCTKTEAVFEVVVPTAKSGINGALVLGIGRAVGETMAVIMVAGNAPIIPSGFMNIFRSITQGIPMDTTYLEATVDGFLTPVRTLTAGIAMEMGYATGLHQNVLFGVGVVLFVIIILLNIILTIANRNKGV
ncbi:MAG: phosphate ABC transporter permease subunit PstC [Defluviitaleaceae bacterium]|nr:phosphate ABC transporter permease subunit PstC [Defluviitaleaceae bacterium]